MAEHRKERVQAYLDPDIARAVRERAEQGRRPESWEINHLLRLGLQAGQQNND
jgi:hypothetical protein